MISKSNIKVKEQKMISKIVSIINVNKVEDPIFNAAMKEVLEICESVKNGTYKVKGKTETANRVEISKKKEIKKEKKKDKFEYLKGHN